MIVGAAALWLVACASPAPSPIPAAARNPATRPDDHGLRGPFLWEVQGDGGTSYLFGTIHVGVDPATGLPELVRDRLRRSRVFICETDLRRIDAAQVMAHEGDYTLVRLPSGEVRRIHSDCSATIGQVGNVEHSLMKLGKAGRTRHRGRRPQVRGSAMNPRDHPHGGGEGKAPVGLPGPKTPWGKPTLGLRTRGSKPSDKYIVRRRYER